jgi:putative ABC transport system permease protein
MLSNYIKIAIRNILRNKLHSFVNIMGLAIGIASAVLLLLMVREMRSYDKHHSKHERIYMVQSRYNFQDKDIFARGSAIPVGPALKAEYPVIEEFVRNFSAPRTFFMDKKGEIIAEDDICYADPEIFKVFDHKFIYGIPEGALDSPNTIVLNKTLAKKYFGDENPIGKTLSRNNGVDYTITGVFEDLSRNSIRHYAALLPMQEFADFYGVEEFNSMESRKFFGSSSSRFTFILLHENADIASIKNNYNRFHEKYIAETKENEGLDLTLVFEPLADAFLNYRPSDEAPPIYLLTISVLLFLAFLILIIACINYMNLATARSEARAMEVGVRKVMGAGRFLLIRQFLCESVVITLTAMLISLVLIELCIPYLNNFEALGLSFNISMSPALLGMLLITTLTVGILSGSYPALVLSSFLPAQVFRGGRQTGKRKGRLRKLLVIVQFTLAIFVINFTFVLKKQVDFWLNPDLGFNMDDVLVIESKAPVVKKAIPSLKKELLKNRDISAVSGSSFTVGAGSSTTILKVENPDKELVDLFTAHLSVDFDFIDMMEIAVLSGRSFSREITTDKDSAFLVNETLVKEMGWVDSPIGKRIKGRVRDGKVIGILRDFHYQSLIAKLRPMVVDLNNNVLKEGLPVTYIKINSKNTQKILEYIEQKWKELIPMYPFEYEFLRDTYAKPYEFPRKLHQVSNLFAFLCVFISCLGLFGLSSFITERRTKEIGIRKVHGASVVNLLINISSNFVKLVFISGIISGVMCYYTISDLGQMWVYHPEINRWGINLVGIGIALVIALVTVSYHAIKAALTDPVKTLRYE